MEATSPTVSGRRFTGVSHAVRKLMKTLDPRLLEQLSVDPRVLDPTKDSYLSHFLPLTGQLTLCLRDLPDVQFSAPRPVSFANRLPADTVSKLIEHFPDSFVGPGDAPYAADLADSMCVLLIRIGNQPEDFEVTKRSFTFVRQSTDSEVAAEYDRTRQKLVTAVDYLESFLANFPPLTADNCPIYREEGIQQNLPPLTDIEGSIKQEEGIQQKSPPFTDIDDSTKQEDDSQQEQG